MNQIAPSILSADFMRLGEQIQEIEEAGGNWLHFDVMDGHFVPSISFGMPVLKSIRKKTNLFLDVHLMVENCEQYLEEFAKCGADMITVHVECCRHLDRAIEQIKANGCKVGIALNPATGLSALEYVLDKVDMILIMTVNPGFGGQSYIPYCTKKIQSLRKMIEERNLDIDIEVDGGITPTTIVEASEAGANIFVAGSAVFHGDISENIRELKKKLEE